MKITNNLNWKTLSQLEKCIYTIEWLKSMCKAEEQKMRLTIWKFIIKTLSNKGLNRRLSTIK